MSESESVVRDLLLKPQRGMWAIVHKGRKVAHGTRGILTRIQDSKYGGQRVSLEVPGEDNPVWTNSTNVRNDILGWPNEEPLEGWIEVRRRHQARLDKWEESLPKVGSEVFLLGRYDPFKVSWILGTRVRIHSAGSKNKEIWDDVWNLVVQNQRIARPPPPRSRDYNPLGHLPPPLCSIKRVEYVSGECYAALNSEGDLVSKVPQETASRLSQLLKFEA
jgi:hypothetical protein